MIFCEAECIIKRNDAREGKNMQIFCQNSPKYAKLCCVCLLFPFPFSLSCGNCASIFCHRLSFCLFVLCPTFLKYEQPLAFRSFFVSLNRFIISSWMCGGGLVGWRPALNAAALVLPLPSACVSHTWLQRLQPSSELPKSKKKNKNNGRTCLCVCA